MCVLLCVYLLSAGLLTTTCFSSTSRFTFTVQRKPAKLADRKSRKSNAGCVMQLFHNCLYLGLPLLYYFLFYLRVTQQRAATFFSSDREMPCSSANKKVCAERGRSDKPRTNFCLPKLTTVSHFCFNSRTFHLPLPLSDEGKCQETVEDSPLLRTFPT